MSIIPINNGRGSGSNSSWSLDLWDPMALPLHIWEPFSDFPFLPDFGFGSSVNTRLDWRETPRTHVWKVVLPGFTNEDVLVKLEDDRMLEVSLESGNFMSRFRIPDDANLEQLKATMNHGVLIVTVPKVGSRTPDVRAIEIEGSG